MIALGSGAKVYLAVGRTDLRKGIDGLSLLVAGHLAQDPFSGHVFGFCNRERNSVKLLVWDRNGFWLLQKRLEQQKFRWPQAKGEVMELSVRELSWLLEGLDPLRLQGHSRLEFSTVA